MSRVSYLSASFAVSIAALLGGCAHGGKDSLYMWESFPRQQYVALLKENASSSEQIRALESHAEKARGENAALPPGFRAHLGMLYLSEGNPDQARQLWLAEKAAFPESAPYMDQLLAKLGAPAKTAQNEKSL